MMKKVGFTLAVFTVLTVSAAQAQTVNLSVVAPGSSGILFVNGGAEFKLGEPNTVGELGLSLATGGGEGLFGLEAGAKYVFARNTSREGPFAGGRVTAHFGNSYSLIGLGGLGGYRFKLDPKLSLDVEGGLTTFLASVLGYSGNSGLLFTLGVGVSFML